MAFSLLASTVLLVISADQTARTDIKMTCKDNVREAIEHKGENSDIRSAEPLEHNVILRTDGTASLSTMVNDGWMTAGATYDFTCATPYDHGARCASERFGQILQIKPNGTFVYMTGEASFRGAGSGSYAVHTGYCYGD